LQRWKLYLKRNEGATSGFTLKYQESRKSLAVRGT